ncbi:hypothetical protein JS44_05535 [Anoxybacillus flavithermus]|uniref:Uncharacterized protein n=1 Tax=Anoxybacillus flavithermus TaxID=33934 RepID=A0A094IXP2_9BACL|nr:hypothetical protein JS44_05535 [Anoxybacillus flavithermus]
MDHEFTHNRFSSYDAKDGDLSFQKEEPSFAIKVLFPYISFLTLMWMPFIYLGDRMVMSCFAFAVIFIFIRQFMTLKENRQLVQQLQTLNNDLEQKS